MKPRPLYEEIAILIDAIKNCQQMGNAVWEDNHRERLQEIERNHLPSGAGFDSGSTINLDRCSQNRIVIESGFHMMDEWGSYIGWIHFDVIVVPVFGGIDVIVKGPFAKADAMDLKEYIATVFFEDLNKIHYKDSTNMIIERERS